MNLLISTIPLLNKAKKDVFLFFKGAGVSDALVVGPFQQWEREPKSINKFDIVRQILTALNQKGEVCLRERREVLKRVVEFENFSVCWDEDRLKARGLVTEVRELVNVKDSFTRIDIERERERKLRLDQEQVKKEAIRRRALAIETSKNDLFRIFAISNPQERGKALEPALNALFKAFDIGIRDAFTVVGGSGEGVVEQIDGVIDLDGHVYFVEMKWWNTPLGVPQISEHLVRVYHRAEGRALIISASDFTEPAISTCRDALQQKVIVLCTLEEIVLALNKGSDFKNVLREKIRSAIIDKNPYSRIVT
ncbi:MAG: restriction endonuclease [Deltaproteobacteria bacterium]|nr:restriction endonuclease [Deltaproteobacteria bacterium]